MKMKNSKDLLDSVLKTTQMGQIGIRSILKIPLRASLRAELNSQLKEYDAIETEANNIAAARGWEPEELDPATKMMATMWSRTKLAYGNADSKIAAMMINGNTKGMIKGLKNTHHSTNMDPRIKALSQKLLDYESANIRQMQGFV